MTNPTQSAKLASEISGLTGLIFVSSRCGMRRVALSSFATIIIHDSSTGGILDIDVAGRAGRRILPRDTSASDVVRCYESNAA